MRVREFIKFYKALNLFLDMVIKKIFEGIFDDEVHADFLKFGRGEFKEKYIIEGKKQASKWAVKTSAEFANFLVRACLEKLNPNEKIAMKGVIVSTMDLRGEVSFELVKVKNFKGIRQLVIDTEVMPGEILGFMDKYPKAFFGLTFSTDKNVLKIKAKAPKSGKPGKSKDGEGPSADFCNLKTTDEGLMSQLFFDVGLGWKEIKILHLIRVDSIVYPDNVNELKPEEVRAQSKRKGVLTRIAVLDGVEKRSEKEFEA